MTPEGKVKKAIQAELDRYENHYREMPVPGGYGKSGLDFHVCFYGFYLIIEAKAPGEEPTGRQWMTMDDITDAGGLCLVIDTEDQAERELRVFLARLYEHANSEGQREAQDRRRAILASSVKSIPRREADYL